MVLNVKSFNKSNEVRESEKAIVEMAPRIGTANEILPLVAKFVPKEIEAQKSRVAAAQSEKDLQASNLNKVVSLLSHDELNDYDRYKQLASKAAKSESSLELHETGEELEALKKRMPPKLLRVDKKFNEATTKYETEQERLEKLRVANKNCSEYERNSFEVALEDAPLRAHERIKALASKATLSNPDEFEKMLEEEKKRCENELKSFNDKDSEIGKLNKLFHEIEQYRGKSGRGKKLYAIGQALTLFKSKTGQTETVLDSLAEINLAGARAEVAKFEENVIMINAIDEAQAEVKRRKAVHASSDFLNSLSTEDLKGLGISNSVLIRTPEVLLGEARQVAGTNFVEYEENKVKELLEEFNALKDKSDKKRMKRLNSLYLQTIVELGYAIPSTFQKSIPEEESKKLTEMRHELEAAMDKKAKQLDLKLSTKVITSEHINRMIEHFTDSANWDEEEIMDLSRRTYWDLIKLFSSTYNIKVKDVQESLDDFVKRQLELSILLRKYKPAQQASEAARVELLSLD